MFWIILTIITFIVTLIIGIKDSIEEGSISYMSIILVTFIPSLILIFPTLLTPISLGESLKNIESDEKIIAELLKNNSVDEEVLFDLYKNYLNKIKEYNDAYNKTGDRNKHKNNWFYLHYSVGGQFDKFSLYENKFNYLKLKQIVVREELK